MISKKAIRSVCLFLLFGRAVSAQDLVFDPASAAAYVHVMNLEPARARQLLPSPRTPGQIYVASLAACSELVMSEDRRYLGAFEDQHEKWLGREPANTAAEQFLRAELHLQLAFVYLKFNQEFDAALHLRKSYLQSREVVKNSPAFIAARKTAGVLNIIIGSVPEKYEWLLSVLNLEGSVDTGLRQLDELRTSDHVLSREANLWYAFIQGFALQQPGEAIGALEDNREKEDRIGLFLLANLLIKNASSEKALDVLRQLENGGDESPLPYTHYLKGEVLLHKGSYAAAIEAYTDFLARFKGQNYVKDALYKKGVCHWLLGNRARAQQLFSEAARSGKEVTEADRNAARSLVDPMAALESLTRARYFTDGGYYEEARSALDEIAADEIVTRRHQTEYWYRKARLAHKTAHRDEAIALYRRTIEVNGDGEWYFAPNACLQLGYLYLENGDEVLARQYFNRALRYKRHEYKNSIDSKARSALGQLDGRR